MERLKKPNFLRRPRKHRQLNAELRDRLAMALRRGLNQKEVASLINVHPSTVSRELRRNSPMGFYDPKLAQLLHRMRKLATAMADRLPHQSIIRHQAFSKLPVPRTWILWLSDTVEYQRIPPRKRPRYIQTEKRKHRLPYRGKSLFSWLNGSTFSEPAWPPSRRAFRIYSRNEKPFHFLRNKILFALMHWELDQEEAKQREYNNKQKALSPPRNETLTKKLTSTDTDETAPLWPKAA
ncbi:hypothetical protein FUAX_10390 [Fulvitalea axinellae]|uniref:Transposase IS30-like HTH domain-containing protein n=1 Tax=Fulvitalea axinellae TaxID=1182444 RepID=A0AAU9CKZ6_9BACT|nr:hypothetical protein FUAX_10390 [Fulvitalea axinellae]